MGWIGFGEINAFFLLFSEEGGISFCASN